MAKKHVKNSASCPFWSSELMKCKVCHGGLFIPLDDHKEVFCTTLDYPQCLQYSLQSDDHHKISEKSTQSHQNRRQHFRFETAHPITLVKMNNSSEIVTHLTTKATTLDVSKGGMRLFSRHPLLSDTTLRFSLDDTFPEPLRSGICQVKWCNRQIDIDGYEAGISFQGQKVIKAMETHLAQQH